LNRTRSYAASATACERILMPTPVSIAPWSKSLETIDTLADLPPKLSLVFIVGPGDQASTGLGQIGDLLAERREVLWHQLDQSGARLTESLATAVSDHTALLVHGLELLDAQRLHDVERNLNLGRDALSDHKTMIVFWIPQDKLDGFRNVCPDLFHWRSHLATVIHDEIEADLVERWRYLDWAQTFLEELLRQQCPEGQPNDSLVVSEDGTEPVPFFAWADEVSRGLLEGAPGSGKTVALKELALSQVRNARQEHEAPIPVWVPLTNLATLPESYDLDAVLQVRLPSLGTWPLRRELLENWARRGEILLVLDGLDQGPDDLQVFWRQWLRTIRVSYPRIRLLVAIRPESLASVGWQPVKLLPWDTERPHKPRKRSPVQCLEDRSKRLRKRGIRNFVDTFIRSLDPEFEPSGRARSEAVDALRNFKDLRIVDALVRSLDPAFEADPGIRMNAARSLGEHRAFEVADILSRSLDPRFEPSRDSRFAVAIALGKLGDPRAIDTLNEYIEEFIGTTPLSEFAAMTSPHDVITSLVQIGNNRAARVLRKVLDPKLSIERFPEVIASLFEDH
jgi:hypothetical protein